MNSKHITIAAALIAAPLLAVVAQTASASTISLTDSWTQGTATHLTGSLPTLSTASQSTSNLGNVSPLSNPKTQSLTQGVATSGEVLFVAVPNGSGTNAADIPITFTLSDGIGSVTFTDYINYYANFGTDTDDLAWTTSPASPPGYLSSAPSLVQTETLSADRRLRASPEVPNRSLSRRKPRVNCPSPFHMVSHNPRKSMGCLYGFTVIDRKPPIRQNGGRCPVSTS